MSRAKANRSHRWPAALCRSARLMVILALALVLGVSDASRADNLIRRGDVLITTRHSGFLKLNPKKGKAVTQLLQQTFDDVAVSRDGRVYVGGAGVLGQVGLWEIDRRTLALRPIAPEGEPLGAQSLSVDSTGNLLVAGDSGLLRVDPATGQVSLVARDGFLVDVGAILELHDRTILVSAREGVVRVDPDTGEQRLVVSAHQAPSQLKHPGMAQACDGSVFIGQPGVDGVMVFDPSREATQVELRLAPASNFQTDVAISARGHLLILGVHGLQRLRLDKLRFEELSYIGPRIWNMSVMPGAGRQWRDRDPQRCPRFGPVRRRTRP